MTRKRSDTHSLTTFCRKKLSSAIKAAVYAFFPNTCAGCGRPLSGDEHFCDYCYAMLNRTLSDKLCLRCGSVKKNCKCAKYIFVFEGCTAPFTNTEPAKTAMYNFKFHRKEYIGESFAKQMALSVKQSFYGIKFDAVCCVPLKNAKELSRGYNQSKILAGQISKLLDIPFYENALSAKEKKHTQHTLPHDKRFDNVKGIYYTNFKLTGKTVLLVDDIKTTGATLNECAKQLIISGADSVYCVTGLVSIYNAASRKKKGKTYGN